MDAKVEAAETTPYASRPSDENSAPPAPPAAAGGGDSVGDEVGFLSGEEFEGASDKPMSVKGNLEKVSVVGVDNSGPSDVGSLVSPVSESVPDDERPPSSEVGGDGEIHEKGDLGRGDPVSPEVNSPLSPMSKGPSNEVGVSEEETFEDARDGELENVSVGVGEKEASGEGALDEKPDSDEIGEEKVDQIGHVEDSGNELQPGKSTEEAEVTLSGEGGSFVDSDEIGEEKVGITENEVKGVEETDGPKNDATDAEVKREGGLAIDSETREKKSVSTEKADDDHGSDKFRDGDGVKLTDRGDSIIDWSAVESVHVDVAKPGVVVVGDVEGSEEVKVKEMPIMADDGVLKVDNKFDQIGNVKDGGNELQPYKSTEETGESDSIVDSSTVNTVYISPAEPGIVVVGSENGEKNAELEEEGNPYLEESNDLTAVYDGNLELAPKDTVEVAKVESDGPNLDVNSLEESENVRDGEGEAPVAESSNLGSVDKKEESSMAAEANAEVGEVVSEKKVAEEGSQAAEDVVSTREFSAENKQSLAEYGSESDEETDEMIFGSSEAAKQFLEELEKASSGMDAHSNEANISNNQPERIDGQIVTDSEDEEDSDDDREEQLFDSAALSALLKAATGGSSEGGNFTITSQDGTRLFSVERPAGLGSSLRSVKPAASRPNRASLFAQPNAIISGESEINLSEEERKKLEKLQSLRVKFLRLVQRLGHSAEDSIAAQVLYRLALLAGRQTGQLFSLDAAKKMAVELEAEGKDDLDFSINILALGKAGVGKSATINSILGDQKASIDAFRPSTTSVREISGTVGGVKITVIDTPGLKSSAMDQSTNSKLLSSVKKVTKKCPPDIVLYVDRLDAQNRDLNNLPLLRTITANLGSSIWKNAIVTLTHAASAPPDGPSGTPLSYDVFVAQCSHIVQQSIGQAVGDLRLMNPSLMNPVSLVENHPLCRKNRDGEKVLPNGQTWRPQLLLLCYSLKILSEANSLLKPQEPLDHRKLFGFRVRSPPLPYLLSWLLQSRTHPKLSADQGGDSVDSDIELDDVSDSEQEDGEADEYDQLPPFKPLRRSQLAKLTKEQRKAYYEEYDYRAKLLQKKQWREELRRMREMKKKGKKAGENEYGYLGEEEDPENAAPAAVPVPLPDMVLPPSFDGDNPAYRYRFLEPTSQLLTRPVLDTHGWDHDCGYDGVNVEHSLAVANSFPAAVTVQVTKDKKEFNIHLDSSASIKHGENGSTMAGFDIQNVGKQLAYVVRGETKFKNLKKNKTTLGGSVTFLGENVATGVKLEDQIAVGKRVVLVGSTGTMRSQGDSAYGANLEIRLREADFPIGQDQSSLGLSLVKWRGDLALGANLQSQVSVGRHSKIAVRAGLNNKMSGQITVRTSSSDQLQIALAAILPIAMAIYKSIRPGGGTSEKYSMY
ncbi:PREDICTED: translocase of chloroplast 159, chloroplastic-like isoform X2 [Tarenaya hassleriana]|uniref:translocase of chloroplast 159, chloroplastic-like isoform X2 n=1 Tax=Tarenaya hassleriana TaxID=28532 RepID=UPI0008FCFC06|nr:PREDICTED: translocase of chloroplast 159, chloroplastic-like isoform X2 [Tarenaya hassleriana]